MFGSVTLALGHQSMTTPSRENCAHALESRFNTRTADRYDARKMVETTVEVTFHGTDRRTLGPNAPFGGHKYETVSFYVTTIENRIPTNVSSVTAVYCVVDDADNVMGIETDMR
jgi:hypothetical protein